MLQRLGWLVLWAGGYRTSLGHQYFNDNPRDENGELNDGGGSLAKVQLWVGAKCVIGALGNGCYGPSDLFHLRSSSWRHTLRYDSSPVTKGYIDLEIYSIVIFPPCLRSILGLRALCFLHTTILFTVGVLDPRHRTRIESSARTYLAQQWTDVEVLDLEPCSRGAIRGRRPNAVTRL